MTRVWLDLVRDGRQREDVVWFYKLDLDPAIELPGGWRSIDYMVLVTFQGDALAGPPDPEHRRRALGDRRLVRRRTGTGLYRTR